MSPTTQTLSVPLQEISALSNSLQLSRSTDDAKSTWVASAQKLAETATPLSTLKSYAQIGAQISTIYSCSTLIKVIGCVDHLRVKASPEASKALIVNLPAAVKYLPNKDDLEIWLNALCDISDVAPKHVIELCGKTQTILSKLDAIGFSRWVSTGVTSTAGDKQRIDRYFSMVDPASREIMELEAGTVRLAEIEKSLAALPRGFWNQRVIIRPAGFSQSQTLTRTSFDDTFLRVPTNFDDVRGERAEALFQAAITHVGAHIQFSGPRKKPKSLKPIQLAIISILEDARVELLAGRKFPGLLRLWKSFHSVAGHARPILENDQNCACNVVADSTPVTDNLLARLARALIDDEFEDDNPWVQKGRRLFLDAGPNWNDADDIRRIGVLLGNDLGQMRLQFNAKTYVVQPPYRDDNLGLWDFGEPPEDMSEELDLIIASMRIEQEETDNQEDARQAPDETEINAASKPVNPDEQGVPICKLPEWDYLAGSLRPNWVTVIDYKTPTAPAHIIADRLDKHSIIATKIEALVRQSKVGQVKRLKRQQEGDRLDLDACIQNRIDLRLGQISDVGLYESNAFSERDLSVLVLLDISESTKDLINGTSTSIFHLERDAAALLAHAMDGMGDPFAIHAFCSNGRKELRYHQIKNFGAPYNDHAKSQLAGMRPGLSTRLGGALRYAGTSITIQSTKRKLVLVITDGEPSDIDVSDQTYLLEDSRKAVIELASQGIDVFAVGLDSSGQSDLARIFGTRNTLQIDRIESLPERLPMIYFRLVG